MFHKIEKKTTNLYNIFYTLQYIAIENKAVTVRYSNVLNLNGRNRNLGTTIVSGLEFKTLAVRSTITRPTASATVLIAEPPTSNYGTFVQVNPSYKNVYLSMGLRYESSNLFQPTLNPRIGLTTNFILRGLTVKPKIAWGRGITAPTYSQRFGRRLTLGTTDLPNANLRPQSQDGFDYGVELYDQQGKFRFEAVYYDNIIKDMIAELTVNYFTNVCQVANRGLELSGEYQAGRFELQGSFTSMNSTIKDSTGNSAYAQLKIAPGERLVNLPRHIAGLNVTYNFKKVLKRSDKGSLSLNVTEVDGVKSVDHRNYALDVSYGRIPYTPGKIGYAVIYKPVFRVGFFADYFFTNDLKVFVQGANILNDYKYDYSNEYPTHGASWLFGFNYKFSQAKTP
ncbi:MAG: TonB-dependent receptor [Sphingobacteriales bacterium]|nr:MAG: TonB-dependent receptor [Sphingobacteriales bacterium]